MSQAAKTVATQINVTADIVAAAAAEVAKGVMVDIAAITAVRGTNKVNAGNQVRVRSRRAATTAVNRAAKATSAASVGVAVAVVEDVSAAKAAEIAAARARKASKVAARFEQLVN